MATVQVFSYREWLFNKLYTKGDVGVVGVTLGRNPAIDNPMMLFIDPEGQSRYLKIWVSGLQYPLYSSVYVLPGAPMWTPIIHLDMDSTSHYNDRLTAKGHIIIEFFRDPERRDTKEPYSPVRRIPMPDLHSTMPELNRFPRQLLLDDFKVIKLVDWLELQTQVKPLEQDIWGKKMAKEKEPGQYWSKDQVAPQYK